jgi:two-component system phosphate regulon sensor histidine kinase PhoR
MKNNKKLGIILLLVVSLPALFFSVYEIGSLNQNEKIIEEIYNNQLEVILTSVNQYSDDVAHSWASNLSNILVNQPSPNRHLAVYLNNYASISGFFYTNDTSFADIQLVVKPEDISNTGEQVKTIERLLLRNESKTEKLLNYFRGGYRKIEPLSSESSTGLAYFVFVTRDYTKRPFICGIIINTRDFVKQVLAPKIQVLVKESFIVSINDDKHNIYSSEPVQQSQLVRTKKLWLLPELKLGIVYKSKTIHQLVRERSYLNLGLIVIIDILFLIGTWFVFRSFKTELELAKMRSDFISNVSHEIRTPLALMSVYVETLLLGRLKPDKMAEYHKIIYQETSRLTDIVNKILNFSKIEEKKYQYIFTEVDINELVEVVVERFSYHLKNSGFELNLKLDKNLPKITGDKEALIEVLVNLMDNAIKYSNIEKSVSLETLLEKNFVVFKISDKGVGINETQQKFIFDKFYRGTETEVHNIKGSGLGLAIVKHIVEGHKGQITVQSEPEKGTTFTLSFPVDSIG